MIRLTKIGNGEKVHAGYEVTMSLTDSKVHHIATQCNYYPKSKARFTGVTTDDSSKLTCPVCRRCTEKQAAAE